jgi:ATP-dependent Lon protease
MAWTSAGGGELLFVESSCYFEQRASASSSGGRDDGGRRSNVGSIHVTGSLGDVMKESCHIALSWLRSNASLVLAKSS